MDSLSQLIGSLRLRDAFYTRFEASAPWGHRVTHRGQIKFVLVARGTCWVRTAALPEPLELQTGDLFLVLDGAEYSVSERRGSRCVECQDLESLRQSFLIRYGGGGTTTTLVSVALQLADDDAGTLVGALPPFIHLRVESKRSGSLHALTELLRDEIQEELGSLPIVRRLAEALFISAVRYYVQQSELPKHGLLAAIADPQLRRALSEMHEDLAHPWTVETLAARSGMSRASFAAKFRSKTGNTPLDYLTKQRIALARTLLREELPIAEIASRVGYESQISFARAFGRIVGTTPGAFRRDARQAPANAAPATVP
ncbi:MAG: AraC family transcriptional regulator [Polyangiaceae bacterium]